jgi:REP element-mobilizing transposase RayT
LIRRRNYLSIPLHLIWSTQNRQPYITADVESRLYDFCAAVARRKGCDVLAIGGTENHIHLLVLFPATIRLCDLLRDLKAGSSHFMLATLKPDTWFDWQNGYAAIAVSPSHRKRIIAYIQNQKHHHANGTTEELLERDGEPYETDEDAPDEDV